MAKKELNLGELADALHKKCAELTEANKKADDIKAQKNALEAELLAAMDKAGTDLAAGKVAKATKRTALRVGIADWDKLTQFVLRHKALHLFERRISSTAYKELKEAKQLNQALPGFSEYEQTLVTVSKV